MIRILVCGKDNRAYRGERIYPSIEDGRLLIKEPTSGVRIRTIAGFQEDTWSWFEVTEEGKTSDTTN